MHPKLPEFTIFFEGFDPVCRLDAEEQTPTVGHGFNMLRPDAKDLFAACGLDWSAVRWQKRAITRADARALLMPTLAEAWRNLFKVLPDADKHDQRVQLVVADLLYNMGWVRFTKFQGGIAALRARRYALAGLEFVFRDLKDWTALPVTEKDPTLSGYWRETKNRAEHHINLLGWIEKQEMIHGRR